MLTQVSRKAWKACNLMSVSTCNKVCNLLCGPEEGEGHFHIGLHGTCGFSGYRFSVKISELGYKFARSFQTEYYFYDNFLSSSFGRFYEESSCTSVFQCFFLENKSSNCQTTKTNITLKCCFWGKQGVILRKKSLCKTILLLCVNYVDSRWGYTFPVRHIPIPLEAHPYSWWDVHSRWVTSPFPVRMCIPDQAHLHSPWSSSPFLVRCAFPVSHIPIPGEDESQWRCDSPGMHILTGNGDVSHRQYGCVSPAMGIWLTGNAHILHKMTLKVLKMNDIPKPGTFLEQKFLNQSKIKGFGGHLLVRWRSSASPGSGALRQVEKGSVLLFIYFLFQTAEF